MHIFQGVLACVSGLVVVFSVVAETSDWLRRRSRLRRATAIVVGQRDSGAAAPGHLARSAVFEFRTDRGVVVRTTSSFYAGRGPKVGRRLPILYDPDNPYGFSERRGVLVGKAVLALPMLVLGVFLVTIGVRTML
ncbi:DUF3592 domain-containing protein [Nocardia mexicana]|uniref:DUF3592 domain-containing protein n=1 Tax=Nocardia mexicana TaxID=279262 RepID=A0A370HB50_9NOCA|nr:DUF3592 domain-containing protein [Nocardia mexicana]RDI53284.1 hypothetical protein DFR68_103672 [Nocardia mexicana]